MTFVEELTPVKQKPTSSNSTTVQECQVSLSVLDYLILYFELPNHKFFNTIDKKQKYIDVAACCATAF